MTVKEFNVKTNSTSGGLSLSMIGLITFIVFLILKLCNQNNPDFEWLTWFWVWFPLWIPWAIAGGFFLIALICYGILTLLKGRS